MRLTASRQVAKVITGCKPKSAAVLPAITDIPYSAPPGRTQSPCEPGQPSTAAELASERGPGRPAVASANTCSCARVCRPSDETNGRAAWREGEWQLVSRGVVAGSLNRKQNEMCESNIKI